MVTKIENGLPATSKVWVYQSARKFTEGESATIRGIIKGFVNRWTTHKVGVIGDGELLFNRFVVLMADESQIGVSGCSVDSSVHFVKDLANEYRTDFFDRWNIAYIKDADIHTCAKADFESLLDTGIITDETIVFNNLVNTKADFEAKWQVPYHQSWLKNLKAAHTSFNSIL